MVLSADSRHVFASVYGGGIFGKNKDSDRRIAVIDLEAKSIARMIDIGEDVAPHGLMLDHDGMLWCTAELASAVQAIDPVSGTIHRIGTEKPAHWLAISHATDTVFASCKTSDFVAVIDRKTRQMTGKLPMPELAEGLAISPDGETLFVCAHRKPELSVFDVRSRRLRETIAVAGGEGKPNQLKRVRISPAGGYVCVSSLLDNHVAIFDGASLKQIASIATPKAPMGFGFAADEGLACVCCHDAAELIEFELASGHVTHKVSTASGCEFVVSY
jgi:DNA-binding beta-propeller fold protein YncE